MKYAWLILAVLAGRFFSEAIAFPANDGDLFWQRWLGRAIVARHAIPRAIGSETFSAPGAPWTPQEWAFSLLASSATGGVPWIVFASGVAVAALAALALVAWHAVRRGASPRAVALVTALAGLALFASFGVRVQVVAWPLLAAYLFALELDGTVAFVASVAIAALWANLHASAILAPIFAGVTTLGLAADARAFDARVRRMASLALASGIAICLTPLGWDLPRYAIALFSSPIKRQIQEWQPVTLAQPSFAYGALPLLAIALLFAARDGRRRFRDLAIVGLATFLLFGAARNIAVFAIIVAPYAATALTRQTRAFALGSIASNPRAERFARVVLPAASFVIALVVAATLTRSTPDLSRDRLGTGAIASLETLAGERRLLCEDFAWCSLALGLPHVRVFLDGRADPYPVAVWRDLDRVISVRHDWRAALKRYDVDTILARRDSALDQALDFTRAWRPTFRDDKFVVWIRSDGRRHETARATRVGARG